MKILVLITLILIGFNAFGQLPVKTDRNNQIIEHDGFTLSYNEDHEQANWVFYVLKKEDLECDTKAKRKDNFHEDDLINSGSATLDDYKRSGYDRGHLKPAADEKCDQEQMNETFVLSNMSPQNPSLNRGGWKRLENYVRELASNSDSVYVYTGPIYKNSHTSIGENKVTVPSDFFKIAYVFYDGDYEALGFIMPNSKIPNQLSHYSAKIEEIELLIGFKFPKKF